MLVLNHNYHILHKQYIQHESYSIEVLLLICAVPLVRKIVIHFLVNTTPCASAHLTHLQCHAIYNEYVTITYLVSHILTQRLSMVKQTSFTTI